MRMQSFDLVGGVVLWDLAGRGCESTHSNDTRQITKGQFGWWGSNSGCPRPMCQSYCLDHVRKCPSKICCINTAVTGAPQRSFLSLLPSQINTYSAPS